MRILFLLAIFFPLLAKAQMEGAFRAAGIHGKSFKTVVVAYLNQALGDNIIAIYGSLLPLKKAFPEATIHVVWPFCPLLRNETHGVEWLKCTPLNLTAPITNGNPNGPAPADLARDVLHFQDVVSQVVKQGGPSTTFIAGLRFEPLYKDALEALSPTHSVPPLYAPIDNLPFKVSPFEQYMVNWLDGLEAPYVFVPHIHMTEKKLTSLETYFQIPIYSKNEKNFAQSPPVGYSFAWSVYTKENRLLEALLGERPN